MASTHIFKGCRMIFVGEGDDPEVTAFVKCSGGSLTFVVRKDKRALLAEKLRLPGDVFESAFAIFHSELMDQLSPLHQEAVMLHEVGHIKNNHHLYQSEGKKLVTTENGERIPGRDIHELEADAYAASFLGGKAMADALVSVLKFNVKLTAKKHGLKFSDIWPIAEKKFKEGQLSNRFKALAKL